MKTQARAPWQRAIALLVFVVAALPAGAATNDTIRVTPRPTSPPVSAAAPSPTRSAALDAFDDHSVARIGSLAQFDALARSDATGRAAVKFTITEPLGARARVHLYDSKFFSLHDEWYWFRLLNGQPVPGAVDQPVQGLRFTTVAAAVRWARTQSGDELPIGLEFSEGRLLSTRFYEGAVDELPRRFGVGAVVRFNPAKPGGRVRWLLELEFAERVTPEWLALLMDRVSAALPTEIGSALEWVVRSPDQDATARRIERERLRYHDRIVRYGELVEPGTTEVYSGGIAIGRLRYIGPDDTRSDGDMSAVQSGDIVVTEHVPDWLPPAAAVITSDPQTPLAHINLLARNRRIPNVSMAGVHRNAALRRAAEVRAFAVVVAQGQSVRVALVSDEDARSWRNLPSVPPAAVPSIDVSRLPLTVDLVALANDLRKDALSAIEVDKWRPIIGGKSAGFLHLLATPGLTPPPDALAITVRPYVEHLAPLRPLIAAAIADPLVREFPQPRWLVLEGREGYADRFPSAEDATFAEKFLLAHRPGTPLGDVLAAGGIRSMIRSRPIAPATLRAITDMLTTRFRGYKDTVGLRFRSSSSVEDIEGFNGAGLYTSTTGFLHPERQPRKQDRDETIEYALLRSWSSYWSIEAFDERELEGIAHLSGAMGLTVHARFDDDLERNNGVATFTFLPGADGNDAELEINVQHGAVAVTNPDPQAADRAEIIRVRRTNKEVRVERVSKSSLEGGRTVLDDRAVLELFRETEAVTTGWRTGLNRDLAAANRVRTVVLDFEFKTVKRGWPAKAGGSAPAPERLVLRQVRSLDPGLRRLPAAVRALPVPHDVLSRAVRVERVSCAGRSHLEVFTDSLRRPDLGYSRRPWTNKVGLTVAGCQRSTLFTSPEQFLLSLLDRPSTLPIS